MEGIHFSLTKINNESENSYFRSKILGAPAIPMGFLSRGDGKIALSYDDYFLMQLDLSDIKDIDTPLPKEGMLYFFIDIESFIPKVFYAQTDDVQCFEVWDDMNKIFPDEFGKTDGYLVEFYPDKKEGSCILSDPPDNTDPENEPSTEGQVVLLKIDCKDLPGDNVLAFGGFEQNDGKYIFLIGKEDLAAHDFSRVKFLERSE